MTKLERFIRTHYNLTLQDEVNLPDTLVSIQDELDSGEYDSPCGCGISEYTLYDLVDDVLSESPEHA
jgi:hypothetical protein